MTNSNLTGAQAVLASLVKEDVNCIFGYPGGAIMPIYDALYDYQHQVKHILVRHEQGAIHAAQGYARSSYKTGVVLATSGPGATNLVTGLADAFIDSTPLVCITGQVASPLLGSDAFQETDIIGISLPITKWNYQITKASEIPMVLAKAFYIARSGRPGPVLIDITKDAQFGSLEFSYAPCLSIRTYNPVISLKQAQIDKAAQLINAAQKPLLIVGQGVLLSQGEKELLAFVEKTGIPTASTLLALGALAQDHPNYVGLVGMHGNYGPNIMTNQCDVLIAVGMRFDDRVTGDVSRYAKQAKIIHIDIDKAEINKIICVDVGVHGDAKEVLTRLLPLVETKTHPRWSQEFVAAKEVEQDAVVSKRQDDQQISMQCVVRMLSELTQGNAIVVTDVGQHQMITARYYTYKQTKSNITSGGLGTMGFALPAAIGAKLAQHNKTVIAVAGDGGFQMNLQELGTIMQNKLDVKIIILNNQFLGMVRQWQQMFFDKRYSFTAFESPDFVALAKSYQIQGKKVTHYTELQDALETMLTSKGAFLLEVMVETQENVFPMIPTGAAVSEIRLR